MCSYRVSTGGVAMLKDEITIRIVGNLAVMFPESNLDQNRARFMIDEILNDYEVQPMPMSLVPIENDIQQKVKLYLTVKALDGLSPITLDNYRLHLKRFAFYFAKPIDQITTIEIRMYLSRVTQGMKATTLATAISVLKSFYKWLCEEEYISKNQMSKIKQPRVEKRIRDALTIEELEILKESCETLRERALVEFAYCTGCRVSEIESVNISDINWDNLNLNVIGKGDKERTVYISPKAKIHLRKYILSRTDQSSALFVREKRPFTRLGVRAIQREFNSLGKKANLNRNIYPHLMRHTMATLTLNNGADIVSIQEMLGHTNPATTQIYARITNESVQQAHRKHLVQ